MEMICRMQTQVDAIDCVNFPRRGKTVRRKSGESDINFRVQKRIRGISSFFGFSNALEKPRKTLSIKLGSTFLAFFLMP